PGRGVHRPHRARPARGGRADRERPGPAPRPDRGALRPHRPVARIPCGTHSKGGTRMSTLVAIAYPDTQTAERVRGELIQATKEHLITLEDAVVVEHQPDGKIKLHQAMSTTGVGAASGALWGGLIGLIFLAPLFGMAIGAAAGGVAGKVTDTGVN